MPLRSFWSIWTALTLLCLVALSYFNGYQSALRVPSRLTNVGHQTGQETIASGNATAREKDSQYAAIHIDVETHAGLTPSEKEAQPEGDSRTGVVTGAHDCANIPGGDEIFLVLKTGATEIYEKLPMHLMTLLRCTTNYAIFSDLTQQFPGYQIHDALERVRQETRDDHPDFELYRTQYEHQATGQNIAKLRGDGGWDLDKWKFLPMVFGSHAMASKNTKWYVFVEADTSLSWSNLLLWLQDMDPEEGIYAGSPTDIGNISLAHGGSGFVISHTAVTKMVTAREAEGFESYDARWENATSDACCGDEILARALLEAGIRLTDVWPLFQGESLGTYRFNNEGWCKAPLTFHHVEAHEVLALWNFQTEWTKSHDTSDSYKFKDVFHSLIAQHISGDERRASWDNWSEDKKISVIRRKHKHERLSDKERESLQSADACQELCRDTDDCMQWRWKPDNCHMGTDIRLGVMDLGDDSWTSGWLSERIQNWVQELDESC